MKFFEDLSMLRKMGKKKEKNKIDSRVFFRVYRVFGRHYKPYIKVLVSSYMCLFLSIGMAVLEPWPLKIILDYIILGEPMPAMLSFLEPIVLIEPKLLLAFMALMIIVLATLGSIFSYINKFWVSSTGDRINADIRERTFAQLQRLSLSFHDSSRSGNLIYLLTSDNDRMKNLLIKFPQDFSQYLFTYLGYSIMLMLLDWKLALIALCTTPLLAIFTFMFGNGMKKAMSRRRKVEGEVASIIQENMSSMMLVQAYGRESSEFSRFEEQNRASLKEKLKFLKIFKSYSRVSDFMIVAAIAGVLYFGGVYALGGVILPGTLVVFVAYLQQMNGVIEKLSEVFMDLSKSLPSGERMLELVENDDVVADDTNAQTAPAVRGAVTSDSVGFAYRNGKPVLQNLNFDVKAGQTVALVGHSGAGKSTIISLILRFYDPQTGQIRIDGQDIRSFTIRSLRDQITILMQDVKLFRMSVRENIAFGKPDATEAEIIHAAKLAEAHDFIMKMPNGYDTVIDEGGDNLSGGQRQRINIARAIIRNKPIVILDEPHTGLDAKTEYLVNQAIEHLTEGKTAFIIAHKLHNIIRADSILLLEKGLLAKQGTHQELMENSPEYREFYELQFISGSAESSDKKEKKNKKDKKEKALKV